MHYDHLPPPCLPSLEPHHPYSPLRLVPDKHHHEQYIASVPPTVTSTRSKMAGKVKEPSSKHLHRNSGQIFKVEGDDTTNFEKEEDLETLFNSDIASFLHDCKTLELWRTNTPKWMQTDSESSADKSLLHSESPHRELKCVLPRSNQLHCDPGEPDLRGFSYRVWVTLTQSYYTFNVWPLLKQNLFRWNSLALFCGMNVANNFFLLICCPEARQLSEITLRVRGGFFEPDELNNFTQLVLGLGRIPSLRRLHLGLGVADRVNLWSENLYAHIFDSILHALTHSEITINLPLPQVLDLMKNCKSAQFIKIGDIIIDVYLRLNLNIEDTPLSHIAAFQLSSLNTLVLSISYPVYQLFKYLDLPNLQLLSLSLPRQTDEGTMLFISSLTEYIATSLGTGSLQMLHIDLHGLALSDITRFLSCNEVQSIPILEVSPLWTPSYDFLHFDTETAFREILSINSGFKRELLMEAIPDRQHVSIVGWVDGMALEKWEGCLRGWGMGLKIVDVHRRT